MEEPAKQTIFLVGAFVERADYSSDFFKTDELTDLKIFKSYVFSAYKKNQRIRKTHL